MRGTPAPHAPRARRLASTSPTCLPFGGGGRFLFTPQRQIKSMFMAKRIWATGIYLTMLLATLIAAFAGAPAILLLLFIFVQWCALVWYFASYIPYGQKMITKAFSSITNFA